MDVASGLCERCRWSRRIVTRRAAAFRLCRRSEADPRYERYPRLPVLDCRGYQPVLPARRRPTGGEEPSG